MSQEEERRILSAYYFLSWIFVGVGIFTLMPYISFIVAGFLVRHSQAEIAWIASAAKLSMAVGQLLVALPIFTLPIAAMWLRYSTGSRTVSRRVFMGGLIRYAPVAMGTLLQYVLMIKADPFLMPAGFGMLVLIYGVWLLTKSSMHALPVDSDARGADED
ncbi:MAG: hypothetical protein ABII00_06510 [Elusimicrobiota bacterium]